MKQEINITPTKKPEGCQHEQFGCYADVNRILGESIGTPDKVVCFSLDLKVHCVECGTSLEFVGLPLGMSFYRPTVSIDGQEARLPMVIPGQRVPSGMIGFGVTMESFNPKDEVRQ